MLVYNIEDIFMSTVGPAQGHQQNYATKSLYETPDAVLRDLFAITAGIPPCYGVPVAHITLKVFSDCICEPFTY